MDTPIYSLKLGFLPKYGRFGLSTLNVDTNVDGFSRFSPQGNLLLETESSLHPEGGGEVSPVGGGSEGLSTLSTAPTTITNLIYSLYILT